jgi:hypothetical protein
VEKEQRSATSVFRMKPELKISTAAMEAAKHNPKMADKEEWRVAQGQGCGKEGGLKKNGIYAGGYGQFFGSFSHKFPPSILTDHQNPQKLLLKINCALQHQRIWPKLCCK